MGWPGGGPAQLVSLYKANIRKDASHSAIASVSDQTPGVTLRSCKMRGGVVEEGMRSLFLEVFNMASPVPDAREELFVEAARRSYRRLQQWRHEHPTATLGEIEQQARAERRLLMGQLIPLLIGDRRRGPVARPRCPHCGKRMSFQGERSVPVETLEGSITLERPYYYCRSCHEGLFPPRPGVAPDGAEQ